MKILELSLQAFGPFTDVTLDFSGGHEGLHIVYGPNEAGKSSAMRGLRQALFGFPHQSPDDFLHDYKKFRVGMRLRDDEGRELAFVRRKTIKNPLLAADGSSTLPDAALARVLGGLTEAEFSRRFAMDHDELVAGGQSILEGAGELGQLLFQAGGGLKDLLEVRRGLDRELESLFKPTGSKPRINLSLAELKEARALVREGSLPSTEWVEHDAAYRRAAEQIEEVERRLESARAERRRLGRIAEALPILARLESCRREAEALGPVVILPEDFTEHRHRAISQLESARAAESAALRAVEEIDAQLEAMVVPDDLLAEADAIERLRDGLAGYRKAQETLPAERGRLQLIEDEAGELSALGSPSARSGQWSVVSGQGECPSSLTTDHCPLSTGASAASSQSDLRAQRAIIARLAADLARLTAERDHADGRVAELSARLESEEAELERIEIPGDPEPLSIALRQARDQGDLDAQVASTRARLDQAEAEAKLALAQLPLCSGAVEGLLERPVPTSESVDRFEAELAEVDAELARLRTAREAAEAEAADADAKLSELRESSGVLPTEDDLAAARARRDRIWRLIRRAIESGDPPTADELRAAVDEGEGGSSATAIGGVASAFERAMERADGCADRLRREAERVAAQASARAAIDRARLRLSALDEASRRAAARDEEVRGRWRALWRPSGIDPLTPREMRAWLQARQVAAQKAGEARARRDELEVLLARSAAQRAAIGRALSAVGEVDDGHDAGLGPLRDRAEAVVSRISRVASRRDERLQAVGQTRRELESARAQVRSAGDRLRGWRDEWARAVSPLGLPPEAAPEQADAVLEQAATRAARLKEAREARARIEASEREADRFAVEVLAVARRLSDGGGPVRVPDASDPSAIAATAQELIRRLAEARASAGRREALRLRREQEAGNADGAVRDREAAGHRLAALCREAGCASADDLPAAERASAAARQARDRLRELDEQLGRLRGHEDPEAFRDAATAVDVDRLPDRIAALSAEVDRLAADRDRLIDDRARHRTILDRMDGEGRAAEANERVEHLKSRLSHEVEEYARLRLAAVVLAEAVERHRRKTEGPVLDRAGALFAALTLGSFAGLRVDHDDPDRPRLQAVRPDGEAVDLRGLSLGTADQLYLALRIAGLETALAAHGPVPLIADDLLIQFDDPRTAAALRVLAGLSDRTQILLFTHHEHVCDLARSAVPPDRLFLHRLPGRMG